MAKIIGIKLQADTRKLIETFEDEVMIRHNNQQLVGTVYVDMQENRWAVAFASRVVSHAFDPLREGSRVRPAALKARGPY